MMVLMTLDRVTRCCRLGGVAILSSAGGIGKSTLTLEVASAAVTAAIQKQPYGAACGLRVAPGPVYLISYEDSPVRIAHRLQWMNNDNRTERHPSVARSGAAVGDR